jgi:hypothetical protein
MLLLLSLFATASYIVSRRPDFSPEQIRKIQAAWGAEEEAVMMDALDGGHGHLKESLVQSHEVKAKYLSPDYINLLRPREHRRQLKNRLVQAKAELDDETRARMLAAAFLKNPGETILAGVAIVISARNYSKALVITDHIKAEEIANFAIAHELAVAGCIRALDNEEAIKELMRSSSGTKALAKCIKLGCYEVMTARPEEFEPLEGFESVAVRPVRTRETRTAARSGLRGLMA